MAVAKKTTRKKTASRASTKKVSTSSGKKSSAKKTPTKKKKTTTSKPAPKKKVSKPTSKKKTTTKKKTPAKKTTSKKTTTKKTVKKPVVKKSTSKKKSPAKKTPAKTLVKKSSSKATKPKSPAPKKTEDKPKTKPKTKPKRVLQAKAGVPTKIPRGRSVMEVATATTADAQGYVIINGRRVRMISTKNQIQPTKKKKTKKKVEDVPAVEPVVKKVVKTKMHKRELDKYKKLLLIKRAEIAGDLSALEAEALRSNGGDISHMPIHMADLGSDTYEQDFMLGMAESERQRIREIDDALHRIENRTYGVCQMTFKPIPKARLEAKPWAKYTIEAARQVEGSWGA